MFKVFPLLLTLTFSMPSEAKRRKSHKRIKKRNEKSLIDRTHERLSRQILELSRDIDNFFADSKYTTRTTNKSKLRISLDTFFREGRGPFMQPDINYQLVLPQTQRRLQLFIENEDQSRQDETEDTKFNSGDGTNQRDENDITAGLRYAINATGIEFSFDTGVLVNVPIVVFSRFIAKKSITFDQWVLRVNEEVRWVNNEGFSSNLDLDFDKKLSRKFLLRMVNNTFWNDQDYTITFENGPTLIQKIDYRSALTYLVHVISVNSPDFAVDNYIAQVSYRRRLYKKWLFMQVTPFLNFPRERNFHRTPGLVLSLDALIGYL